LFFLSICPSANPSMCLSVRWSVINFLIWKLSVCLYICLSDCRIVCLSVFLSFSLSVFQSVCLSAFLPFCLSVYLTIFYSFCLSTCPTCFRRQVAICPLRSSLVRNTFSFPESTMYMFWKRKLKKYVILCIAYLTSLTYVRLV